MFMEVIGRAATRAPPVTVAIILLLTVFFGSFAAQMDMQSEEEDFNPDTEMVHAQERIEDYFGPGVKMVQIIARSTGGDAGDVLTRDGLLDIVDFEEAIVQPKEGRTNITATIERTELLPSGVQSVADLVAMATMIREGVGYFALDMIDLSDALSAMEDVLDQMAYDLSIVNTSDPVALATTLTVANATVTAIVEEMSGMTVGGAGNGNGNGGNGLDMAPDINMTRSIIENLDDALVKDMVRDVFTFDPVPYENLVMFAIGDRDDVLIATNNTTQVFVGLSGSIPPEHDVLVQNITQGLMFIEGAVAGIGGFEALPHVFDSAAGGIASGLKQTLSMDFDVTATTLSAKAGLMVVQQNGSIETDMLKESQYDLEDMAELQGRAGSDVEFLVVGQEILFDKINTSSMESLGTLLVLSILFIVVILALVFRSLSDTFITLSALMFVITWTFGMGILLGYTFNPLTIAVPILLVGLAVDYGIHLTMRYRSERGSKSTRAAGVVTITSVGTALLLATITTVFSFMSNVLSSLSIMRQFGLLTSVGIISAFFIMNTYVPALRIMLDERRERRASRVAPKANPGHDPGEGPRTENPGTRERRDPEKGALARFVQLGARGASRAPITVVVVAVLLSGGAFFSLMGIESEFDFMDFLPEELPETQTINYLMDEFNFSTEKSAVLLEGNVATPKVFDAIDRAQRAMADDRDVVKTGMTAKVRSPLTVVQRYCLETSPNYVLELGEVFALSDTDGDGVPDERVEELLLAMMADPFVAGDLASVIHISDAGEFDAAIVDVSVHSAADGGEHLSEELSRDIKPLKDLEDRGVLDGVILTGGVVLSYSIITEMNEAGLKSVVATIIAAAILLMIVFYVSYRTVMVGLLTTIPIVLVVGWMFSSMLLLSIPLNVITITIAALTVGLGITYAIHISHRFLEDLESKGYEEAMRTTVGHTGAALFGAAATTIGGFGILAFSILPPLAQFGIVTALSILYSFLASVFVLPSFLTLWAKRKYGPGGAAGPAGLGDDPEEAPEGEKGPGKDPAD